MKNAINYFYNIAVDDIHQTEKMFYFDYGGYRYALVAYTGDRNLLPSIYKLHLEALQNGLYVHQIILNKDNQIATPINDKVYVLMRIFYDEGHIDLEKILPFMSFNINDDFDMNRTAWENLWSQKIDYLEYEISQLGEKYPEIRETFSYFVGLGETSITLVNMVLNNENKDVSLLKTIGHHRINNKDTLFDLYNPLNLVVDYRVRDVAGYLKSKYFAGENIDEELGYFLNNPNITDKEHLLFLARMLYPSYYFDIYEEIISGLDVTEPLKKITMRANDYQNLIKQIYLYYKSRFLVPQIEWLER